jgi:hypothetical protein
MVTIRVPFDDWFEVEIHTFNARFGQGNGRDVEAAIADATKMLLELDEVIAHKVTSLTVWNRYRWQRSRRPAP